MLGLVLWMVVIVIIGCSICPELPWGIAIIVVLVWCIGYLWENFSTKKALRELDRYPDRMDDGNHESMDLKEARDEWEAKWGRKHPARK